MLLARLSVQFDAAYRSFFMRIAIASLVVFALFPLLTLVHRSHADDHLALPTYDWKALDSIIGAKGTLNDDVYTYLLPRNDLNVAVDGMDVPAGAGIASQFYFYKCSCGKIKVVGQFCCADYEANDVIDAIRPGAILDVSNIGPMFIGDKPRVMVVRFQGEGDATAMAKLLKSALGWMGDARTATHSVR
jgi:hypothetical protein